MATKTLKSANIPSLLSLADPISNADLWNGIRAKSPSFASLTAKATYGMFTANGYEQLKNVNPNALNEFFNLSLRTYLQLVNISHARDSLEGVFETYYMPLGAVIQRLTINPLKPVSPAFHGLVDGTSVDPYIVRKPETNERFWHNPISFQNVVTIQDFQMKEIFITEFGMSEFVAGILAQLAESWTAWKFENKLNAINAGINSTDFPLQDTQVIGVKMANVEAPTADELTNYILDIKQTMTAMSVTSRTSAFNAAGFSSVQDKSRLRLLVRAGFQDAIDVLTIVGAFNPEYLSLGIEIVQVPHFGGLQPYKEAAYTTPLYPVYDQKLGTMIGWAETEGATSVTVQEGEEFYKDPNADIIAVLCDKGWIFETITNEVRSDSIWNPRGLYTNTFFSCPNYYTSVDSVYNMVAFKAVAPNA